VCGEAGTGKSTFINKFLHLEGDRMAKSDIIECTNLVGPD